MLDPEAVAGTALALDCDGTLVQVGETEVPDAALRQLTDYRANGGYVALLSGRGERHLRSTLDASGIDVGIGECGYLLVDVAFGVVELRVPSGFHSLYSQGEPRTPVSVMRSLGIPQYLDSLKVDRLSIFQPHRNQDRRATYCCRGIRGLIDLPQLNEEIQARFGPGFRAFRNGCVGELRLPDGSTSSIDTIHVAPCDPLMSSMHGKAHGLALIAELLDIDTGAIHYGGDSVHDLDAGSSAGCRVFGVANCEEPEAWIDRGADVMRFPFGYGVAEYIIETFSYKSQFNRRFAEEIQC